MNDKRDKTNDNSLNLPFWQVKRIYYGVHENSVPDRTFDRAPFTSTFVIDK